MAEEPDIGEMDTVDRSDYLAGDAVIKVGKDYNFCGWVVSVFWKRNGTKRYVVENADGVCLIFRKAELVKV